MKFICEPTYENGVLSIHVEMWPELPTDTEVFSQIAAQLKLKQSVYQFDPAKATATVDVVYKVPKPKPTAPVHEPAPLDSPPPHSPGPENRPAPPTEPAPSVWAEGKPAGETEGDSPQPKPKPPPDPAPVRRPAPPPPPPTRRR